MRSIASLVLLAVAVMGCAASQEPKLAAADPNGPLCAFSGLPPASPEWSACLAAMPVNPDRDLLVATIAARTEAEASGAPDVRAEMAKRTTPIFTESMRRARARQEEAESTGKADCGAWHWDVEKELCRP